MNEYSITFLVWVRHHSVNEGEEYTWERNKNLIGRFLDIWIERYSKVC